MNEELKIIEKKISQLEKRLKEFSELLTVAFQYITQKPEDPKSSLTKCRIILERMLKKIYLQEMGHPPKGRMVGYFLNDKEFTSKIPSRILTRMNFINKMGCLGPHDVDDVHPIDAQRVINNLLEVIDWFWEKYESEQDIISQEEGGWEFDVFLNQLTPVFENDNREWEKILKKGNRKYHDFNVFWNAGAGLNLQPVFDIKTRNVPERITDALSPDSLYIMTDYSKQLLQDMKMIYRDCDKKFFDEYTYFSPHKEGYTLSLDQIVPCRFFSRDELKRIRGIYTNYHPSMTSSVIPDDVWHFCFMKMSVESLDVGFKIWF